MSEINERTCRYCFIDLNINQQREKLALVAAFVDATDSRYGFSSKDLRLLGGSEVARISDLIASDHGRFILSQLPTRYGFCLLQNALLTTWRSYGYTYVHAMASHQDRTLFSHVLPSSFYLMGKSGMERLVRTEGWKFDRHQVEIVLLYDFIGTFHPWPVKISPRCVPMDLYYPFPKRRDPNHHRLESVANI
jgi:hypothetical protein